MNNGLYLGLSGEKAHRRIVKGLAFEIVRRAFFAVSELVGGEERKLPSGEVFGPESTLEHVLDVGVFLTVLRAEPEVIAAGFLHDVHEDFPEIWTEEKLRRDFGDAVADLVLTVSKPAMAEIADHQERWFQRNAAYRNRLVSVQNDPVRRWALGIAACDKVSNLRWSIYKMGMGVPFEHLMKHPWEWDMRRLIDLCGVFHNHIPSALWYMYRSHLKNFWASCVAQSGLPDDVELVKLVIEHKLHR